MRENQRGPFRDPVSVLRLDHRPGVSSHDLEQPDRYNAHALLSISLVLGTLTALAELASFATLRGQAASASETSLYWLLRPG